MDQLHSTTTEHRKGKHLSYEERVVIQTRLKDGWTPNRIAKAIAAPVAFICPQVPLFGRAFRPLLKSGVTIGLRCRNPPGA